MPVLHHCKSCGHLSTVGSAFNRICAANGRKVTVCDECASAYGKDADVTRWTDHAGERLAAEQQQRASTALAN